MVVIIVFSIIVISFRFSVVLEFICNEIRFSFLVVGLFNVFLFLVRGR